MTKIIVLIGLPCSGKSTKAQELSKKYDDEKSYVFVNGVLNAIAESLSLK